MKNPYMPARKRPIAGLPELFMKNDTVIGTMGNTQGVSKAAKPHRIASMINAHSEPPPAASFCAGSAAACAEPPPALSGASATAALSAVPAGAVSCGVAADAIAAPACAVRSIVISVSSGGMQLVSSQIIHSSWAVTAAFSAASFTRWAKSALPAKVPISISKVLS